MARRWIPLLWLIPIGVVLLVAAVLVAQWLRTLPDIQSFIATHPGETAIPAGTPVGFPWWLQWQHALNAFFLLLIVRTGLQIGSGKRPPAFWTRRNDGLIRTKNPPRRLSIHVWFHLVLDALWVLNGLLYWVLLFPTGQWLRLVPVSWDVVPHALSVGIQYLSLDWPTHNGWIHYNALQLLMYGFTVFVAAPLALFTGLRLSSIWPPRLAFVPEKPVRALHVFVMLYFVAFTVVHVGLVLATGALRNLNHMYAGRDDESWIGLVVFAGSLVVMIVGWVVARPALLTRLAALGGAVRR
ncbi:cytochrome b/b6 domain-containing protein [Pseudolysinimonas sp.]|uniref:cytochrome b/b6 domain-containing protein n=1 Tax=Pseudolysinimonas sp. TaxID=2680009 RepID=UPI003784FF40